MADGERSPSSAETTLFGWPPLVRNRPTARYRRDHVLYVEGEAIDDVALLRSGIVRVSIADHKDEACVALRTPGWLIGAAGAVTGRLHIATVTALSECVVSRIAVGEFNGLRMNHSEVSIALQSQFASDLHWLYRRAASIGGRRHRGALEHLLRDLFAAAGVRHPDGSVWLEIGLSAVDLAAMLGITRQWTSSLLSELAMTGDLRRIKGRFVAPPGSGLTNPERPPRA